MLRRAAAWTARVAAILGTGLLAPGIASASGIDAPQIGSTWSSPTTRDAAAMYWNPGMLGFHESGELLIGVGFVGGQVGYQRDRLGVYQYEDSLNFAEPIDPSAIDPNKTGAYPRVRSPIASPTGGAFIAAPLIKDRLVLGFGAYAPYAAPLKFDPNGAQKFQLQQAFIAVTQLSVGIGVKVHRRVSLGATISYVLGVAQLARIQDFGAVDLFADAFTRPPINQPNDFGADAPSTVRELDVLARPFALTDAVSHGVAFNVGLAANPVDPLWLGVTYDHGSRANFRGRFQLDMNDEFFTQDLAAKGLAFPPLVKGGAALSFRLPKRLMLGIAYDISDRLRIDGNFAWAFWSDVDAFRIRLDSADFEQPELGIPRASTVALRRDWKGAFHGELNVRLRLGKQRRIRMSGTVGYHSSASPDSTIDVASPDGNRLLGAMGVGYQIKQRFALLVDAEVQGILPRTVTSSKFDLGNGRYDLIIASVGLWFEVKFGKGGKVVGKPSQPPAAEGKTAEPAPAPAPQP